MYTYMATCHFIIKLNYAWKKMKSKHMASGARLRQQQQQRTKKKYDICVQVNDLQFSRIHV